MSEPEFEGALGRVVGAKSCAASLAGDDRGDDVVAM
jgi:hypothetical protein